MVQLMSGALERSAFPSTADGLRILIHGAQFTPINVAFRAGKIPVFMTQSFSLMDDFGFIINVWAVRDEVENFKVIGGVTTKVDKSQGYKAAYRKALDLVLSSDEASSQAIDVVDHVLTNYLQAG